MAKSKRVVLAIDQGTTGTHVTALDERMKVIGTSYLVLKQHFPEPGWVEHSLTEIWTSTEACITKALKDAGAKGQDVCALGITNQRETTALWHRGSGKPLYPAIVWQDRRTASLCAELKARGEEKRVRERTGLVLDPYFSATKLRWLLQNVPGAKDAAAAGELAFGTIDSWLVYKLTGRAAHVTDVSNASRTLLLNLHTLQWDEEMLALFGVPESVLPEVRGSAEVYGLTRGMGSLPDGIPVSGMAGDQQAALFGQACFEEGDAKCTFGTGAFLLMNTGRRAVPSTTGLLTTVAWRMGDETTYALEGSAFIAGAAVQWLRDGLKVIKKSPDIEKLARSVPSTGDVVFVPALAGLGAPHWRPEARGAFLGMDRSTTVAHLARATLEGVALQIYELAEAMRTDSGKAIQSFKVDGGAAANDLLMQMEADFLNTEVVRPQNVQTTSLGAAFLGGLGAGVWSGVEEIKKTWKADKVFKPQIKPEERARQLEKWRNAVQRA